MAGLVKTDAFNVPGVSVLDVVARFCPATLRFGDLCLRFDPHLGSVQACPLLYGIRVMKGPHASGEARSLREMADWMATHEEGWPRRYESLCLAAKQSTVHIGATGRGPIGRDDRSVSAGGEVELGTI